MATASSAQREPSMEEILASIRRIIEDSDSGRKQPEDTTEIAQDIEPEAMSPAVEVDAFRAEFRTEPRASQPIALADVQAPLTKVDSAPEQALSSVVPERPAHITLAAVGAQLAAEKASADAASEGDTLGQAPAVADWREQVAEGIQPSGVSTLAEPKWSHAANGATPSRNAAAAVGRVDEMTSVMPEPHEAEPVRPAADVSASRLAIVSEQTSRQVAAAFGELSEAFASRSKKTFDDKAEEMLKPMLQDWLDNNLPTLVERLVREEIERVARGA
jgi:cell pole-organizing protein PopZ